MNPDGIAKMSDAKTTPETPEPTFEASLNELQELVHVLEDGALGLEESIARFERGILLLRRCFQALERAEQKIELLTGFDRDGNPLTTPFSAEATLESPAAAVSKRPKRSARKQAEPSTPSTGSIQDEGDESVRLF